MMLLELRDQVTWLVILKPSKKLMTHRSQTFKHIADVDEPHPNMLTPKYLSSFNSFLHTV